MSSARSLAPPFQIEPAALGFNFVLFEFISVNAIRTLAPKNSLHFVWAVFSVYGTCCREGVGVVPHALQTASQSLRRLKYDGISMTKK